jgi:cardiolipin synthase A/B
MSAARRRGAQVNVMYDSLGSLDTPSQFFGNMRQHGVSVVEFNLINPFAGWHWWPWHPWSIWPRDHRKLLIVDGKTAFTGGINITADYEKGISRRPRGENTPDMWRDTDVEIKGPAVTTLQALFVAHWIQLFGQSRIHTLHRKSGWLL